MKIEIYYQDFQKNAFNLSNDIVFEPENAVFIEDFALTHLPQDRKGICDAVFLRMNNLCIPKGHPRRPIFEKAGHTSMSIGDYIKFEDGEIWIAKAIGWKVIIP